MEKLSVLHSFRTNLKGCSPSLLDESCYWAPETSDYCTILSDITVMRMTPPDADPALIHEINVRGTTRSGSPSASMSDVELMNSIRPRQMQSLAGVKSFTDYINDTIFEQLSEEKKAALQAEYKARMDAFLKSDTSKTE